MDMGHHSFNDLYGFDARYPQDAGSNGRQGAEVVIRRLGGIFKNVAGGGAPIYDAWPQRIRCGLMVPQATRRMVLLS
jgi:hypothetical protein